MLSNIPWELETRLRLLRDNTTQTGDTERRTQSLERVALTKEELLEYGKQAADAQREIKQIEADLSSLKKQLQAKIEGQAAIIDQKSEAIRSGYEPRMVECVEVLEVPRRGRKTLYRLDTMEAVSESLMGESELQRMLKFEDARKASETKSAETAAANGAAKPAPESPEEEEAALRAALDKDTTAEAESEQEAPAPKPKLPRMRRPDTSV